MIRKGVRSTKPKINEIINEELVQEPQLGPPRIIKDREHLAGVEVTSF